MPNPMLASADARPVSIVMPVHNALPHLDAAIESILNQTFPDFEFVILDDASTDGSTERLREWANRDSRIRLIEVKENLGPAASSNRVARAASAPIVARTDADDISYPDRIAAQLEILNRHSDVGVVGGLYDFIDSEGRKVRKAEPWRLAHKPVLPPFGNGPLMYRREVFERVGGYRKECEFWEDHDLIIRMSEVSNVLVIPRAIYDIRYSTTSTRFASDQTKVERAVDLMHRCRDRLALGLDYEDLLREPVPKEAKLDPRVFISVGSSTLWAGGRPRLIKRLFERARLSFDFWTISTMLWVAWAAMAPTSLRAFLRLIVMTRSSFTSAPALDEPMYWSRRHTACRTEFKRAGVL